MKVRFYILEKSNDIQAKKDYKKVKKKDPLVKRLLKKIKNSITSTTSEEIFAALSFLAIIILILKEIYKQYDNDKYWAHRRQQAEDEASFNAKNRENRRKEKTQYNSDRGNKDSEKRRRYRYDSSGTGSYGDIDKSMLKIKNNYYSILSALSKEFHFSEPRVKKVADIYWNSQEKHIRTHLAQFQTKQDLVQGTERWKQDMVNIIRTKLRDK